MGGDGYALALRAGAPLLDMEFVQFFLDRTSGSRLIGMDPIMWDPFRYSSRRPARSMARARSSPSATATREDGKHVITRDLATWHDHQGSGGRALLKRTAARI